MSSYYLGFISGLLNDKQTAPNDYSSAYARMCALLESCSKSMLENPVLVNAALRIKPGQTDFVQGEWILGYIKGSNQVDASLRHFKTAVHEIRCIMGLSQQEMASRMSIVQSYYFQLETKKNIPAHHQHRLRKLLCAFVADADTEILSITRLKRLLLFLSAKEASRLSSLPLLKIVNIEENNTDPEGRYESFLNGLLEQAGIDT